jgi:hypothetical protein
MICLVDAWDKVQDCNPTDTSTYRIFTGDSSTFGVCQEIAGAPVNGITCREYRDGGVTNGDCTSSSMFGSSIDTFTATDTWSEDHVYCQFYASGGCPENNWDESPQNQCFGAYGEGAVSFKCVGYLCYDKVTTAANMK